MEIVNGYFDFCVPSACYTSKNFGAFSKRLVELGFRTIALNQVVDDSNLEPKKKKKKGEVRDVVDVVPAPLELKKAKECEELKILNRLTVVFESQEFLHKILKSPNYKKYHIIAIQPMSQSALQFTAASIEADILTYDPENKPNYKLNRKLYNQLVDRGFHFEILYAPAIADSSKRKNMIAVAHLYYTYGKSKNIILSSKANNVFLLRSVYDLIHLGRIFGLSEGQAQNAVQNCGKNVFLHSVGRRQSKALVFMESVTENEGDSVDNKEEDEEMELDQPAYKKHKPVTD